MFENLIPDNFLNYFLVYSPVVFSWLIFFLAIIFYVLKRREYFKFLIFAAALFRIVYAAFKSVGQYYIWNEGGDFLKLFLKIEGYFRVYIYSHFWLNVLVVFGAAVLFWMVLIVLKKYKERFFDEGEIELGVLSVLIVGWPGFIVFAPLTFFAVLLTSLFRRFVYRELYTKLSQAFLISTLITLVWSDKLLKFFHLNVFKISL